jgi:mono/diheme cytochrome c family protein
MTPMQMNLSRSWLAIGSLALCIASSAGAQENLDKNKTGAQLYASICADCHKSPQSLKPTGIFGLESFLREHYTADRASAAAIATYLKGLKPVASQRGRAAKRTMSQAPFVSTPSESNKPGLPSDILRPPADIPERR